MKKNLSIIIAVLMVVSCVNIRTKSNYISSCKIARKLYVESYRAGLIDNLTSEYLTDSTNFRIYIGTFDDENGYFYYKIHRDKIYVEKREEVNYFVKMDSSIVKRKLVITPNLKYGPQTINKKTFSLKCLKEQHTFD
jgi:hypothetical protein